MLKASEKLSFDLPFNVINHINNPQVTIIDYGSRSLRVAQAVCDICNFFIYGSYSLVFTETERGMISSSILRRNRFYVCDLCSEAFISLIAESSIGVTIPLKTRREHVRILDEEKKSITTLDECKIEMVCQVCMSGISQCQISSFRAVKIGEEIFMRHDDKYLCSLKILDRKMQDG